MRMKRTSEATELTEDFLKHRKEQKKQKVPFILFIPMSKKYHGTRFSFLLM